MVKCPCNAISKNCCYRGSDKIWRTNHEACEIHECRLERHKTCQFRANSTNCLKLLHYNSHEFIVVQIFQNNSRPNMSGRNFRSSWSIIPSSLFTCNHMDRFNNVFYLKKRVKMSNLILEFVANHEQAVSKIWLKYGYQKFSISLIQNVVDIHRNRKHIG